MTQQIRNRFPRPSSGSQGAGLAHLEDRGKQSCTSLTYKREKHSFYPQINFCLGSSHLSP